ncbi:MAG TPA: YsnF/AvaK domain-containing protein [Abditibacterium sp.]|jgi:uncharacterized protein (TIGR02271 family)
MAHDNIQHGIDDNPSGDAEKGAALGGLGGAAVGAAAGSLAGPAGTLIGAAVGAVSGALASGAAVAIVDQVDNDNTVSGVGSGDTHNSAGHGTSGSYGDGDGHGHNVVTGDEADTDAGKTGLGTGALVGGTIGAAVGGPVGAVVGGTVGSLAGGVAGDASEVADDSTPHAGTGHTSGAGYATGTTPSYGAVGGVDTRPTVSRSEYDALSEPERLKVRLLEEELHVNKEERQTGEVEISKRVVEEQVSVPVTLEREEVVIHRRTITDGDTSGEVIGDSETIVVPVREEFANVTKTAHVTGEVEVEKRVVSQEKTISDTVRHEEIDIKGDTTEDVKTY